MDINRMVKIATLQQRMAEAVMNIIYEVEADMATTTKCAFCGKETHFTRMSGITYQDICVACHEAEEEIYGDPSSRTIQSDSSRRGGEKISTRLFEQTR